MTATSVHDPPTLRILRVRTDKTIDGTTSQDVCVPTPRDWPHTEFVQWLDATKRRLGLEKDSHLAEHLGVGHTLISNWRSGKQRPSWDGLLGVARALGIDVRPLWVLAGYIGPGDVGLVDDTDEAALQAQPIEIQRLLEVYTDPRMDTADRAAILNAVRMVYQGVLADLSERDRPSLKPRRRAG